MIKIDENYSIEIDSYNFTLKFEKESTKTKDGKEVNITSKSEWHYPNINLCLKKYFDETLRDVKELKDISLAISSMYQVIDNLKISVK